MILKKGAQVKILYGKDKGKTGEIIEVTPAKNLKDEERVIKALGLSASIMESIQEDDEIPF